MDAKTREQMRQLVEERAEPVRGLGDVVAKVTKSIGIKPCAPCERRRNWLNKYFPTPAPAKTCSCRNGCKSPDCDKI